MKVFIFGNQGNMGKRYAAILKYLGHEIGGCDAEEDPDFVDFDKIIIATPTHTHLALLHYLKSFNKPILCEKPFINDPLNFEYDLKPYLKEASNKKLQITMVDQYEHLVPKHTDPSLTTMYDYYQSGNDGLAWDCINIIWYAKSKINLINEGPIWCCCVNGYPLSRNFVDHSYISMIRDWIENPYEPQYDLILAKHKKVLDYLDGKFD